MCYKKLIRWPKIHGKHCLLNNQNDSKLYGRAVNFNFSELITFSRAIKIHMTLKNNESPF